MRECRLRLDDPVDQWLPELADRQVLKRPDGPLDDTVSAHRPITVRDLLTSTFGLGVDFESMASPIRAATFERLDYSVASGPAPEPDEWMRRLGELPLQYQPGVRWQYDLSNEVVGVLVSRVTGQSLETFLRTRILDPLGMKDTAFHVPADMSLLPATAVVIGVVVLTQLPTPVDAIGVALIVAGVAAHRADDRGAALTGAGKPTPRS